MAPLIRERAATSPERPPVQPPVQPPVRPPVQPPVQPPVRPQAQPPVRPPARELEEVVRALALPGIGHARMARVVRKGATLRMLARQVGSRLSEGEARKAEGWARTALATIERRGFHVLTPGMDDYPEAFHHLDRPPYAVFAAGRLELLRQPLVAIVGTRSCTQHGRATARRIAKGLATRGVTVVSGLALGIDGAAHRAAGPARTIAILGCGLDVPYPLSHQALQRDIGRHGLLLSEQLPGAPAAPYHFPLRNRMIAALAAAVVVVEAPTRSGALITARIALDLGRPVFAAPGPLGAPSTDGTNALLRDGGILITSAREILDTLRLPLTPTADPSKDPASDRAADPAPDSAADPAADPAADSAAGGTDSSPGDDEEEEESPPEELFGVGLAIWRCLGNDPRHVDDVAAALALDPRQTLASLLSLEVQGFARQLPGMQFVRGG
jgi:DNA processing protein